MRYLLVDRITEVQEGRKIRGVKNIAMSEDFLEHHFPRNPIMPGVMMLEAMVQLAGWLVAASSDFGDWFMLSKVRKSNFYRPGLPGDQLELEIEAAGAAEDGSLVFRGIAKANGKKVAKAEFEGRARPLADIEDVQEQRHHFKVLARDFEA